MCIRDRGKFVPPSDGGRFAEVYADATTVWPLLIKGVLEEMKPRKTPPRPAAATRGGRDKDGRPRSAPRRHPRGGRR